MLIKSLSSFGVTQHKHLLKVVYFVCLIVTTVWSVSLLLPLGFLRGLRFNQTNAAASDLPYRMEVASFHHHQMGSVSKIRSRKKGRFLIKTSAQMRNVVEIEAGCISEYKIFSFSTSASDL